jgi:hypothetical protein
MMNRAQNAIKKSQEVIFAVIPMILSCRVRKTLPSLALHIIFDNGSCRSITDGCRSKQK